MSRIFKRGDICWCDFGSTKGSEQGGVRPAIIIQNDTGNKFSPTVIVCPISSQIGKKQLPTHVFLKNYAEYGLKKESEVITEQMRTRDKSILGDYIGCVDNKTMIKIDKAIEISVNVGSAKNKIESREIKVIREKVEEIKSLDNFIKMWFNYNNDVKRIEQYVLDREIAVKDLELYAGRFNLNYKDYYNPVGDNKVRMVG